MREIAQCVRTHIVSRYNADGPPTNQTQVYRALLHHISFTWVRMQTYPDQMYPPNQTQLYRALLHHISFMWVRMQMYPD